MLTEEEVARWDQWFALDEQANREWKAAKENTDGHSLGMWATLIELNRIDRAMEAKETDNASI